MRKASKSIGRILLAFGALFVWATHWVNLGYASDNEPITVYTAKKIVTMDPDNPTATAVAVRHLRAEAALRRPGTTFRTPRGTAYCYSVLG